MNIETKYDIGDEVYCLYNGDIKKESIIQINISINETETEIFYILENINYLFAQNRIFDTTKRLYKAIEKAVKLLG